MIQSKNCWLQEHRKDFYVKCAKQRGYVSRSAFKLLEINKKYGIFKSGMSVIDLGASPGGWFQVVKKIVGPQGLVVSVDLLPMHPFLKGDFIQGDVRKIKTLCRLREMICKRPKQKADCIISDIAPNISGIKNTDQSRSLHLVELVWNFSKNFLIAKGGGFLAKIFQGPDTSVFLTSLRSYFKRIKLLKPSASRSKSSEIYILATEFLGYNRQAQKEVIP
ncbi:RlmE family RNA methyltransferase [Coxiella endosymbiont of Amblyomma sculptum]|uniref:RlmE family RNA methyltransferase n=1 Tax=Coxiella endosymbiont of Amblyomma sculptum TaxID=2487929 RepID=UPI00132EE1AA|nr:RlmE family RNA methyltransferase [Coxiella endosymbiont of Amblyomma sculptum]QHG92533.1 RlmE family RNA methyltransferase [Coxiella endosymbiont of Amblyomma sculptum]